MLSNRDPLRKTAIDGVALKALPITVEVPQSSLTRAFLKAERLGADLALIMIPMVSRKTSFVRATTVGGNKLKVCRVVNWAKRRSADYPILLLILPPPNYPLIRNSCK